MLRLAYCLLATVAFLATSCFAQIPLTQADYQSIGLVATHEDNIGTIVTDTGKYVLTGYSPRYAPLAGQTTRLFAPAAEATFNSSWVNNTTASSWLTISRDGDGTIDRLPDYDDATFTVTLNFDLTGYQDIGFNINMAFDDTVAVTLNGTLLALTGGTANRYQSLGLAYELTEGSANSAALNQGGLNTLTFVVTNSSARTTSATGFRVEFDGLMASPIPEPSTYALLLGAGVLGMVAWRRRNRQA